ncbi:MAG: replicative DNA helicase [Verrucomicrobiales bacterium]|jgi:replicative DNA helicase|nr:replicative DNA helicase [Verrucomicrobiales bacterium]
MKDKKIEFKIEGLPAIHAPEAERAVLGAMLAEPLECVDAAAAALTAEDFFQPAHRTLFAELNAMRDAGRAIDAATVWQWLSDRKLGDAEGWAALLGELSASVVSVLTFPAHVETVRGKALLRAVQRAGARMAYDAHERQDAPLTVLDEAERAVFEIGSRESGGGALTMRQTLPRAVDLVERAVARKGQLDGVTSGLTELDALTGGFKAGEMIVVAARPSVGKTALALGLALHNIKRRWDEERQTFVAPGLPVGFFSLEMTAEQLMLRLLAMEAEVDLKCLRDGKLTDYALDKIAQVSECLADYPLVVDETSFLTVNQLRARARRMKQQHGVELLAIDYLQLLAGNGRNQNDNRQVEVAEISRGIKALAKELKIPIIVLAQLNRKPEESGQEPALHHLRESGSIEQDADVVILLSRAVEEGTGDTLTVKLNVAKQRNGPTDKITVEMARSLTKFRDAARNF